MNSTIVHGIQAAVAPVFMLTAVAAMIGALATRLSRIIDRARWIEERLDSQRIKNEDAAYWELQRLGLRLHVLICAGCNNYRHQMNVLRAACRRFGGGGTP